MLGCNHPPHKLPEDMQSSDLSRYPPPMMQGLAGAISQALSDIGQEASKPTADWTHKHQSASDELPFRQQVRHMDHGLDRPTSLPLAHRISLMDEHVVVQLGFRTRPLRDGGGKPSPGRLVPPLRKNTRITSLGQQIIDITSEFNQAVQMSISCGEKNHPILRCHTQEHSTMSWGHTRRWSCRGATLFPDFDLKIGEGLWRPRLEIPTHTPGRGSDWGGRTYFDIPGSVAHEGRTQRKSG